MKTKIHTIKYKNTKTIHSNNVFEMNRTHKVIYKFFKTKLQAEHYMKNYIGNSSNELEVITFEIEI